MMTLSEAAHIVDGTLLGIDAGFTSVSTDSRVIEPGGLFVAIPGEKHDGHAFVSQASSMGAVGAMVSNVSSTMPSTMGESKLALIEAPDTTVALGQLGKDWRSRFDIPVIAITGSNGKTTVTQMTASILEQCGRCLAPEKSFNNQWGVPLTLLKLTDCHRFAVIEMGTSHPGEIEYLTRLTRPTVALINNVAPAHLEGLGDIRQIASAKAEIFLGLPDTGVAILNADDEFYTEWVAGINTSCPDATILSFAIDAKADVSARNAESGNRTSQFELQIEDQVKQINLPLPGRHNIMNALAASAICFTAGVGLTGIKDGLEKASGVTGRLDVRPGLKGSTIIDDSYNANPASMKAAINVLRQCKGKKILVLGAMAELGKTSPQLHEEVGVYAKTQGIDRLYCYSPGHNNHARYYAGRFGGSASVFDSMEELLKTAKQTLAPDVAMLIKGSRSSRMERVVHQMIEGELHPQPGNGCVC